MSCCGTVSSGLVDIAGISQSEEREEHAALVHSKYYSCPQSPAHEFISLPVPLRGSHINVIIVLSKRHSWETSKRADERERQ